MSCTITLIPLAITTVIKLAVLIGCTSGKTLTKETAQRTDVASENIINFVNKEYETVFIDVDLLLTTLKEQGAKNIIKSDNRVRCMLDSISIEFIRGKMTQPFKMHIIHDCNNNCEQIISEINSQYGLNVQELSYNKITERLKNSNMQITEEEVLEDNSIMLTIDID